MLVDYSLVPHSLCHYLLLVCLGSSAFFVGLHPRTSLLATIVAIFLLVIASANNVSSHALIPSMPNPTDREGALHRLLMNSSVKNLSRWWGFTHS
jgi:hypothetical protein